MLAGLTSYMADFLRDGLNGNNSSARLVSVGSATILALYVLLDALMRITVQVSVLFFGATNPTTQGLDQTGLITAMGGLVALGTATYTANKWAGIKKAGSDEAAQDKVK